MEFAFQKKYTTIHSKLKWKCNEGHEWEASPANIGRGKWCPYCAGVLSDSEKTFKLVKKIIKNKKGTLLTKSFHKMTTKMEIVCKEGHPFKMSTGSLKRDTWCPKCADNTRNDGNKKTIEDCQKLANSRGGKCLSKTYVNAREKLEWECVNQHKFKMAYGTAFGNRWCPKCSAYTSEEIVRAFFDQLTGKSFPKAYPKWLRNSDDNQMEFDGYNEKLQIAFEHIGEQHYSATAFRQTEAGLKKKQADDRKKAYLAKKNGVHLIVIPQLEANIQNRRTRMSQLNELIADFKKFRKTNTSKHYPRELKERTVELLNEGVPRQELIEKLNIHPTTLSGWKNGQFHGGTKKASSFSKAIIVEDNPEIKVTVVTGLKLSDLKGLLQ